MFEWEKQKNKCVAVNTTKHTTEAFNATDLLTDYHTVPLYVNLL